MTDMIIALRSGYSFDEAKRIMNVVSEETNNWIAPIRLLKAKDTVYHTVATVEFQQLWTQMIEDMRRETAGALREEAQYLARAVYNKMYQYAKENNIREYVMTTVCNAGDYMLVTYVEDDDKDKAEVVKVLNEYGIEFTGFYSWLDDEINEEAVEFMCSSMGQ